MCLGPYTIDPNLQPHLGRQLVIDVKATPTAAIVSHILELYPERNVYVGKESTQIYIAADLGQVSLSLVLWFVCVWVL